MIGVWFTYGVVDALRRRRLSLAYLAGLGGLFIAGLGLTGRFIEAHLGQQLILLTRNLQSLAYFPLALLLGLFFGMDAADETTRSYWLSFSATRASGRLTYLMGRLLAALTLAFITLILLSLTVGIVLWITVGSFYTVILDAVFLMLPGILFTTALGYLLRLHGSPQLSLAIGLLVIAASIGLPLLWEPFYFALPAMLTLFANHTSLADFHTISAYPFVLVQLTGWSAALVFVAQLRLGRLWFDDPFGG
ncbi:hypothetical protein KAU45_04185 [bacterium]|nr:hypothetical protein [bacterium]